MLGQLQRQRHLVENRSQVHHRMSLVARLALALLHTAD
jgi:hypothetical protein